MVIKKKVSPAIRAGVLVPRDRVRIRPPVNPAAPPTPAPTPRTPRQRAERLLAEVRSLERDVAANFYRMGLCLRELKQPQVYGALGFATFEDLLTTLDLGGRYRAHQLIEVVDTLPEPVARDLGSSKSYQAIRYVKLVEPDRDPGPFIASDPPVRIDGRRVPLSVVSARALIAAIESLRAGAPPRGKARAQRVSRRLAQRLHHAGIDSKRVRTLRAGTGWIVDIRLSPEEVEELADLLGK